MLVSAGGLLALGTISLWSALKDAGDRELLAAERATRAAAQDMREAMSDLKLLSSCEPQWCYEVASGALVLPEGFKVPVVENPRHALPSALLTKLADAERHRYRDEFDQAESLLRQLHEETAIDNRSRVHFALSRAWLAHRLGNTELRDQLLDQLAGVDADAYAQDLAGIALLSAAAGRELPTWTADSLQVMDDDSISALLERLAMYRTEEVSPVLLTRATAITEERRTLRTAAANLASLLTSQTPVVMVSGTLVLIYHPSEEGSGRGAILNPQDLWDLLSSEHALSEAKPVFGPELSSHVTPILDPLLGLDPRIDQLATTPFGLPALLLLLGLSMVLSLHAMLRSMRTESKALRLRAEFLTTVTHELKTPLASIRLLSERLDEGRVQGAEQLRAHYSLLAGEALRLTVLIDNVLDLGRLERGERAYDRRPQDPRTAVSEAADLFRPLAERDGIEFEVEITPVPCVACIDHGAVIQALVNVLENARKYAASGKRIVMSCESEDDKLRVQVRDYGPGIAESERERVFERFRRGSAQEHGGVPGVGIGLYLARRILSAQGGGLIHEPSDQGKGSVFVLSLPLSSVEVTQEASP